MVTPWKVHPKNIHIRGSEDAGEQLCKLTPIPETENSACSIIYGDVADGEPLN
jgi:hypothetical protein